MSKRPVKNKTASFLWVCFFFCKRWRRRAASYTGAGLLDGRHGLVDAVHELADVLEVSGHLCGQNHVDDGLSQRSVLIPDGRNSHPVILQNILKCLRTLSSLRPAV